ncbi:MAG: nucleotidyltransferase [bacterium]
MSFEKLFKKITLLFKQIRAPYMVVGGLAVAYWGYPRQSLDLDIVVDLKEPELADFLKSAKKAGFSFHELEIRSLLKIGNRFVMEAEDYRVDCWLPKAEYHKSALARSKKREVFGQKMPVISPEDLILSKLLVGRARDLEDIKTVIIKQKGKLDLAYLKKQSLLLNIAGPLDEAINNA